MCVYMTESPCCAPETLWVDYTSIIYIYIKKKIKTHKNKQKKTLRPVTIKLLEEK